MHDLAILLWRVFLVFTGICLAFCIEAFLRYRHKRGIDNEMGFNERYQYFGQPIYNHQQLYGYELLLREYNPHQQKWQLPSNVDDFPLSKMVTTLEQVAGRLPESIHYLSLNMTVSQLTDFRSQYFFRWAQELVGQADLAVELRADDIISANIIQRHQLMNLLKYLGPTKVSVTVENVDSSAETYHLLRRFLPYLDYVKFNIRDFKKSPHHWIDITLAQWQRRAQRYHVDTAVGMVEAPAQIQLLNQLDIGLREGFAYGRPQKITPESNEKPLMN